METAFLVWPCGKCFQKYFSEENLIDQSLLLLSYQRLLDVSTDGLSIAIQCLRSVLGSVYMYRVLKQT